MEKEFKEQILKYLDKGWSPFPVTLTSVMEDGEVKKILRFPIKDGKESWKIYQTDKITEDKIDWEWMNYDQVAVATGEISGITCVDLDIKDRSLLPQEMFNTYVVETAKGFHLYYRYNPGVKQTQNARDKDGNLLHIDLRNDGGLLFCPPTKYQLPDGTTAEYKIINDITPAEFPIKWYKETFNQEKDQSQWKEKFTSPVLPGSRNMDFASIIGGLLKRFPMDEWESIVWPTVQKNNITQEKPLSLGELRTTYDSIAKAETKARHQGGEIKDIVAVTEGDDMRVGIVLEKCTVHFKIKNIISSLSEANVIAWIEKPVGFTHEIPFYLKTKSDTNKEQWVRILSRAFDNKDNKETYPWTIIVAKVVSALENHIKNRPQCFAADTLVAKECTWLLKPFIQEDMINTIFGLGSSGKTLLAIHFLKTVAQDLGHSCLFIDYEDTPGGFKSKLDKITSLSEIKNPDYKNPLNKFYYYDSEQIPIAEQVDKIKDEIKKHNIKLVIVDSASLATGESTSDEKAAVRLASALKLLKTTVLLIAHQRKNDGDKTPIGSIQYENQSRNVWNISASPDDRDKDIVHIACKHTKANNTYLRLDPIGFMVDFSNNQTMVTKESAQGYFQDKFTVLKRIEQLLKNEDGLSYKDIAEKIDKKPGFVKKELTKGKDRGIFKNKDEKWFLKNSSKLPEVTNG